MNRCTCLLQAGEQSEAAERERWTNVRMILLFVTVTANRVLFGKTCFRDEMRGHVRVY